MTGKLASLAPIALALAACTVSTSGAQCDGDENCQTGQRCVGAAAGAPGSCQACTLPCPAGLTCGTGSGGQEVCVCPLAGPVYYADAVGGSAAGSTNPPTGAQSPPACRFKSLQDALAAASAPGSVVKATGASGTSMTFSVSGTLSVSPQVTLTSDAPACAAGKACTHLYAIAGSSAASTLIRLGAGATLSEFEVQGGSSAANAVETNCGSNSGTVTILDVKVGGSSKTGVYHSGACPLLLQASTITGAADSGIILDASSNAISATLTGNVVTKNNATSTHFISGSGYRAGGGMVVTSGATSNAVVLAAHGNQFAGNYKDQVLVFVGGNVSLAGGADPSACTGTPVMSNYVGCYDTTSSPAGVGVSASAVGVDASWNQWPRDPPVSGTDYVGPVTAGSACTAGSTCPSP